MKLWGQSPPHLPLLRALRLRSSMLDFGRRGFAPAGPDAQPVLEEVVRSFAVGYNGVIAPRPDEANELPHAMRGFAVEGAAMASVLLDLVTLSDGSRLRELLRAEGDRYVHLIHVGAGWAFARLHRRPWSRLRGAAPLLGWLAWDGWGFHQAFFHSERVFAAHWVERATPRDVREIRDQGAGRALWFYAGADPARISEVIAGFPPGRRSDLWAGVGLAAGYTGAQTPDVLAELVRVASGYCDHLGQGAAFAAKAHLLSGAVPTPAAAAIRALTDADPAVAAAWTDESLKAAASYPDGPAAYARWRADIRASWVRHHQGSLR